jgi:hypothetical protein
MALFFRRLQFTDQLVSKFQDNVDQVFAALFRAPFLEAVFIKRVPLVTGVNVLAHGLGNAYRSWIVCAPSTTATIIDAPASIPQDPATLVYRRDRYFAVNASAPVVCDFVVL